MPTAVFPSLTSPPRSTDADSRVSLGLSTKTSKQARREKKRSRREAGLVDGVAAELIDAYLVEHYICDGCGRFQLAMCGYFIEETGEVVLAPCHEWDSEAKAR